MLCVFFWVIPKRRHVKFRRRVITQKKTYNISKLSRKYMSNIPGNHEVKELQITAMLGTAHILRKVLT